MAKLDIEKAIATELGTMAAKNLLRPLLRIVCLHLATKDDAYDSATDRVQRAQVFERYIADGEPRSSECKSQTTVGESSSESPASDLPGVVGTNAAAINSA